MRERRWLHEVSRLLSLVVLIAAFAALIPLLTLTILRIFQLENARRVVLLETFLPYLLLGAYPIFLFAVIVRHRVLALLSAFVVVSHMFFLFPELSRPTSLPARAALAPKLTLFDQNVMYDNQTPEKIGDSIRSVDPDLVFLEELSTPDYEGLRASGALDGYAYSLVDVLKESGVEGLAIFSKYPLSDATIVQSPGFPQETAVVHIGDRTITLWNVHIKAPVDGPISGWRGDLSQLARRMRSTKGDMIVAGDFNSTYAHRPFRDLISRGFREAAIDRGRGYSRTWPVDGKLGSRFKGLIRIDHVLSRGNVRPVSIKEGPGNGSDHRSVITTFALL